MLEVWDSSLQVWVQAPQRLTRLVYGRARHAVPKYCSSTLLLPFGDFDPSPTGSKGLGYLWRIWLVATCHENNDLSDSRRPFNS